LSGTDDVIKGRSYVSPGRSVVCCSATVAETVTRLPPPLAALQATLLSEIHILFSQADPILS
jgi:hypothetical protein